MRTKLKTIIFVPFVASSENVDKPLAEARNIYEDYFIGSEEIQIIGQGLEGRLYISGDNGLYIIGEGKTNSAINCSALLTDTRLDLSDTKFILFGCCGSSYTRGVIGDIYFVSATVDYDLGHSVDIRDNKADKTWYPNHSFERFGYLEFNNEFLNTAFNIVKDFKLVTSPITKEYMAKTFKKDVSEIRDPKILKATSVTSDSYWKGLHKHDVAEQICDYYKCADPYYATQMEDLAVGQTLKKFNKLADLLVIRYSVNFDCFLPGQNAENLWGEDNIAFSSEGFDGLNDAFLVVTKSATELLFNIINS